MKIKIKTSQIKKILEKLSLTIAQHAFLACLFLFIVSLIFGALFFYKYSILARKVEPEALATPVLLKQETYQKVLAVWQEYENRFQQADSKEYPNPFLESVPFPEELTD